MGLQPHSLDNKIDPTASKIIQANCVQMLTLLADRHRCYPLNEVGRVEKRAVSEFFGEGKIWLCKKFYGSRHPSLPCVASARRPSQNYVSGGLHGSAEVANSEKSQISWELSTTVVISRKQTTGERLIQRHGFVVAYLRGKRESRSMTCVDVASYLRDEDRPAGKSASEMRIYVCRVLLGSIRSYFEIIAIGLQKWIESIQIGITSFQTLENLRMRLKNFKLFQLTMLMGCMAATKCLADVGVNAKPLPGAELILDGSRGMLDEKWMYWEGPRFSSKMPIQWKIVEDPVDKGMAVMTDDPAAVVSNCKLRDTMYATETSGSRSWSWTSRIPISKNNVC